jgi:quercetin dioxygenase-like cupin family protein
MRRRDIRHSAGPAVPAILSHDAGYPIPATEPLPEIVMSSLSRPLAGQPLLFHLGDSRAELMVAESLVKSGRAARTLVKEGSLRVTLVALAPGGVLAGHRAEGPITVQVVAGSIVFRAKGEEWKMLQGDVLALPPGVEHSVESASGGEFLVTVAKLSPALVEPDVLAGSTVG